MKLCKIVLKNYSKTLEPGLDTENPRTNSEKQVTIIIETYGIRQN